MQLLQNEDHELTEQDFDTVAKLTEGKYNECVSFFSFFLSLFLSLSLSLTHSLTLLLIETKRRYKFLIYSLVCVDCELFLNL
jgi:hypothetical protein